MVERKVVGGGGLMVNLRLTQRHVLVIGGGKEAVGRVFFALDADARVTLIAPISTVHPEVRARIERKEIRHLDRTYRDPEDLYLDYGSDDTEPHQSNGWTSTAATVIEDDTTQRGGVDLVLGCSDDLSESRRIAISARMARIPVNCADVPDLCDFFFVAVHREGPIQIGVSTNGSGPRMAARIRTHIRDSLPKGCREAVERIGRLRARVKVLDPDPASAGRRMAWLSRLCDVWSVEEMARIGEEEVMAILDAYDRGEKVPPPPSSGRPLSAGSTGRPTENSAVSPSSSSSSSAGTGLVTAAVSAATSAGITASKVAAGATGLALSMAFAPVTLAVAVASGTASAAATAASSAVSTASTVSRTVQTGATHAVEIASTYTKVVAEVGAAKVSGAIGFTGAVVTATVEGGLGILPSGLSDPIKTVMRATIPKQILPLRTEKGKPICYLVGGGPGDPGLLTVKAANLLRTADVVVSDQLIAEPILEIVPKDRLVLVERKVKGRSDAAQADANELCLRELRRGKTVVRLKGGDPFLFGRGAEEVLFLRSNGFESVVIPGVSSCIAAPASVGIPVTHRGAADQFLVLSGRGEGGAFPEIPPHSDKRTTVVLMPVARLGALSDAMVDAGYPNSLPAAVVEKGTCIGQRVVEGTLGDIANRMADANVGSPALFVVGNACRVLRGQENGLLTSGPQSIAVPLYRTALHRTRNSIKRTRSLLTILPNPIPENVRIDPVAIPRRENIVLDGMKPEEAKGTVPGEWVTFHPKPRDNSKTAATTAPADPESERIILFIHGGAFIMGSPTSHRCLTSKFAELAGAKVLAIDYKLAPEHTFPLPLHCCISAYLALVDPQPALGSAKPPRRFRPDQIFFVGDSAGGGLSISLSLWLRDNGYAMPGGIVALAPWVDLTHSQPSFHLNGSIDYLPDCVTDPEHIVPGVRSHAYTRNDADNINPYVSPIFASDDPSKGGKALDSRLPPTLIQVGERERLRDEGIILAAKSFSRSPMRLEVYKDMVHVFQVFGDSVGTLALKRAGEFIRSVSKANLQTDPTLSFSSPGFLSVETDGKVSEMGRAAALSLVEEGRQEMERVERRRRIAQLAVLENSTSSWWSILGKSGQAEDLHAISPPVFESALGMHIASRVPGDMIGRIERRAQLPLYRLAEVESSYAPNHWQMAGSNNTCDLGFIELNCAYSQRGFQESVSIVVVIAMVSTILGALCFISSLRLRWLKAFYDRGSGLDSVLFWGLLPMEWTQLFILFSTINSLIAVVYLQFKGHSLGLFQLFIALRNLSVAFGFIIYLDSVSYLSSILLMNNHMKIIAMNLSAGVDILLLRKVLLKPLYLVSLGAEASFVGGNFVLGQYIAGNHSEPNMLERANSLFVASGGFYVVLLSSLVVAGVSAKNIFSKALRNYSSEKDNRVSELGSHNECVEPTDRDKDVVVECLKNSISLLRMVVLAIVCCMICVLAYMMLAWVVKEPVVLAFVSLYGNWTHDVVAELEKDEAHSRIKFIYAGDVFKRSYGYHQVVIMLILAMISAVLGILTVASSISLRNVLLSFDPKIAAGAPRPPFTSLFWAQLCYMISCLGSLASMIYVHFNGRSTGPGIEFLYWASHKTPQAVRYQATLCIELFRRALLLGMIFVCWFAKYKFEKTLQGYILTEQTDLMLPGKNADPATGFHIETDSTLKKFTMKEQVIEVLRTSIVFLNILIAGVSICLISLLFFIALTWFIKNAPLLYFKGLLVDWALLPAGCIVAFGIMLFQNWKKLELLAHSTDRKKLAGYPGSPARSFRAPISTSNSDTP
ncbi:hypothetical protein HDU67_005482 [Dinochytrium kinnereticum]|nr:hypothetical protein HDU67_005482 [Dinochytrium kinnereticum]